MLRASTEAEEKSLLTDAYGRMVGSTFCTRPQLIVNQDRPGHRSSFTLGTNFDLLPVYVSRSSTM